MYTKQNIYHNCSDIMKKDKSIFIVTQCQLIDYYSSLFLEFQYKHFKNNIYCLENLYNAFSTIDKILKSKEPKNLLGFSAIDKIMQNKNYFAKWIYRDVYIIIRRRDLLAYAENRAKEREYEKATNELELTWQYNNGNYFLLSKIANDNIAHQLIHKSEQLNYEDLIFPVDDVYYSIQVVDKETGFIFYNIIEKRAYALRKQYIDIITVKNNKGTTIDKMYKTKYRKLTYDNQTVLFGKKSYYLADMSVIQSENGPIKFNEFINSFNCYSRSKRAEKFTDIPWML